MNKKNQKETKQVQTATNSTSADTAIQILTWRKLVAKASATVFFSARETRRDSIPRLLNEFYENHQSASRSKGFKNTLLSLISG